MSVNLSVQIFDFLGTPSLILLFRPLVTVSDDSGRNHLAGESVSPTIIMVCWSLLPELSSVFYHTRLIAFCPEFY